MITFATPDFILKLGKDATDVFEERLCIMCDANNLSSPTPAMIEVAKKQAVTFARTNNPELFAY